jgi:hypothetical protein
MASTSKLKLSSPSSTSAVAGVRPRRAATLGKKKYIDSEEEEEEEDGDDGGDDDNYEVDKKKPSNKKKRQKKQKQTPPPPPKPPLSQTIDLTDTNEEGEEEEQIPLDEYDEVISAAVKHEKEKPPCDCLKTDGKLCDNCTKICAFCRIEGDKIEDCKCICIKCGNLRYWWLRLVPVLLSQAYTTEDVCRCGPVCKQHRDTHLCPDCGHCERCDEESEHCDCWEEYRPTRDDYWTSLSEFHEHTGPPKKQSLRVRPRRRRRPKDDHK